ncbi:MAG: uroporphyrinogen-III synthase [Chloroflexi bacterium]|nr:uroporphyrinogen-III synthase [Chloroflexota bacterium]
MKPLEGKRILVTRPRAQAAELCDKLTAHGAIPIIFPTIEIAPLTDVSELDRAMRELNTYDWIIFTSVNGVKAFWDRLDLGGLQDLRGLPSHIAAIGPATARALEAHGMTVTLIPDEYVAEAIVENIGSVQGQRILLPRADIAREALALELQKRSALVDEIAAYRTLPAAPDPIGLAELRRGVDVITFTSSSTVRNFVALAGQDSILPNTIIACIGPITATTARELGLPVDIVATEYTMSGLVAALVTHFDREISNAGHAV